MSIRQIRNGRVKKQIEDIRRNSSNKQFAWIQILEIKQFEQGTFIFAGPIDSPYQGYWFRIKVQWKQDYPSKPPKCILVDKIWSPYVNFQTNEICVDILQNQYSPVMVTSSVILSIASLIGESKIEKDHKGFANPQAAIQMMKNYPYFKEKARKLCEIHSYKHQQIYTDQMRGAPEQHPIEVEIQQLPPVISKQLKSQKFNKKIKKPLREIIRARTKTRTGGIARTKTRTRTGCFQKNKRK